MGRDAHEGDGLTAVAKGIKGRELQETGVNLGCFLCRGSEERSLHWGTSKGGTTPTVVGGAQAGGGMEAQVLTALAQRCLQREG